MSLEERIVKEAEKRAEAMLRRSLKKVINDGPFDSRDLTFIKADDLIDQLERMKQMYGDHPQPITSFIDRLEKAHWQTVKSPMMKSLEEEFFNKVMETSE